MNTLYNAGHDGPPPYEEVCQNDDDYQYENLAPQSSQSFRLLLLEPGQGNEPIRCNLFVASMLDAIQYEALSYVWGDQQNTTTIWVNERKLRIRLNLHAFLSHLRDSVKFKFLWTDAICINQRDVFERGQQVRIMGDIYRNAENVLTWLGEDTYNFRNLAKLVELKQTPLDEGQAKLAFAGLCKARYWSRTWIVQEILLARAVIVYVGTTCIPWSALREIIEYGALKWSTCISWEYPVEMNHVQGLVDMMDIPIASRSRSLARLLGICATKQCLDKRDNVYALLSLATDCQGLIPDYTTNLLNLFFELRETVPDHALLMKALGLTPDEILYRAETLGSPVSILARMKHVLSDIQVTVPVPPAAGSRHITPPVQIGSGQIYRYCIRLGQSLNGIN